MSLVTDVSLAADVSLAIGDRGFASFAFAFAVTQIVETPIYARALAARTNAPPRPLHQRVAIGFGASAFTHPIVWFAMPSLSMRLYAAALAAGAPALGLAGRTLVYGALAEGFAVIAEAFYLRAFGVRRGLLWSLGANAASVLVGTALVWALSGLP